MISHGVSHKEADVQSCPLMTHLLISIVYIAGLQRSLAAKLVAQVFATEIMS